MLSSFSLFAFFGCDSLLNGELWKRTLKRATLHAEEEGGGGGKEEKKMLCYASVCILLVLTDVAFISRQMESDITTQVMTASDSIGRRWSFVNEQSMSPRDDIRALIFCSIIILSKCFE